MNQIEILAPAGGEPQLVAAVRAGADAVYLGAGGFNARQGADNFAGDKLRRAVEYCHARGVRVHVTLNTLITQGELPALLEEIRIIAASGCDAVLVQDLGVARLLRDCCPSLTLHASTQGSIHNLQGVLELERLGFSRVVLARELTGEEIRTIRARTQMELETFVHGALCMSVSGQCYLSSMLGGRSGNRGLCAQPCRLDFTAGERDHVLSLKDLSLVEQIPQLMAAGVNSLKIEGRLKRPEYVAAAVDACRRAREGETPDLDTLRAVFSRGGFTDGFFTGRRDITMFGTRTREDVTAAAGVLGPLEALIRQERQSIPVDMTLTLAPDAPATLEVSDGAHRVVVTGAQPQEARTRSTDEELARRGLEKTGGTPFALGNLTTHLSPGLMVPVSVLNSLRGQALEQLLQLREAATRPHPFALRGSALWEPAPRPASKTPALRIRLEHPGQLTPRVEEAAQCVILPLEAFVADPILLDRLGDKAVAELPLLTFPLQEDKLAQELAALRDRGLTTVLAGGLGAIHLARNLGLGIQGDYSLNILNAQALAAYGDLGLEDALLSFEGNLRQYSQLGGSLPRGVIGYGHLPLMTVRNCPAKGLKGCGHCRGQSEITDRRGAFFPVLCRNRHYSQLLNPVALWVGDRQQALRGLDFVTLRFTLEDAATCDQVVERFLRQEPFFADVPRTGGLYFRELL